MKDLIIDWTINITNLLIYILIFTKAIGTPFFNTFDLVASLVGISAGVIWLVVKAIKKIH